MSDIPEWALAKACKLTGWRDYDQLKRSHPGPKAMLPRAVKALAAHIAEFEEPQQHPLQDMVARIIQDIGQSAASLTSEAFAERLLDRFADEGIELSVPFL